MAALDFPASPTNGQVFLAPNGVVYQWSSASGVWLAQPPAATSPGGDVQVFSGARTVPVASADSVMPFPTTLAGNGGAWWANNRYTPPPGKYFLTAACNYQAPNGSNGTASVALRKNGVRMTSGYISGSGASQFAIPITYSEYVDANGTDYFDWVENVSTGVSMTGSFFSAFPLSGIRGLPGVLGADTGVIVDFAGDVAPGGWLLCQGQLVSRTTFANLFAVIGTKYGVGDGSTTFALPDLGGRVTAGREATATRLTTAGAGIDGATLGATGGGQTVALDATQTAAHTHGIADPGHAHGQVGDSGHYHYADIGGGTTWLSANSGQGYWANVGANGGPWAVYYTSTTTLGWAAIGGATAGAYAGITASGSSGSGVAHQNTQPTIIMNKIIKV